MEEKNSQELVNTSDFALEYDHHKPQEPDYVRNHIDEDDMELKPWEASSSDIKRQDTPRYGVLFQNIQVSIDVIRKNRRALDALTKFEESMGTLRKGGIISSPTIQNDSDSNSHALLKDSAPVKKPIDTLLNDRKQKALEILKSLKKSIEAKNVHGDILSSSQIIKNSEQNGSIANLVPLPESRMNIKQRSLQVLKSLKKMMEAEQIHPVLPVLSSISNKDRDETTDSDSEPESVVTAVDLLIRRKQSCSRDTKLIRARRESAFEYPESDAESIATLVDEDSMLETPRNSTSTISVDYSDYSSSSSESESIISIVGAVERLKQLQDLTLTNAVEDNENNNTQKQLVRSELMQFSVNDSNTWQDSSIHGIIPYDVLKQFMNDFDDCLEKAAVHVKYGKKIECTCFNSTSDINSCIKHIETANLQFFDESVQIIQIFCNFLVDEKEYFFAECSLRENCPNYYKKQIAKLSLYLSEEFLSKNTESRRQLMATFERILEEEDLLLKSLEDELIIGRKRNIATRTDANFNLAIDFIMKEYPALFVQIIKERNIDQLSEEISFVNANRKVIIEKSKLSQKELHAMENQHLHE